MIIPNAGWLCIKEQNHSFSFIPRQKYQHLFSKNNISITLNSQLKVNVVKEIPSLQANQLDYLPVRIKKIAPNQFELGPFIAILTSEDRVPFSGNHHNFCDIIRTGKKMGVSVFVVTPKSFHQTESTVIGYLLDPHSKTPRWHRKKLPMPNIIYNRIPTRKSEQSNETQQVLQKLLRLPKIHLYNPHFFNKWTLYKELMNSTRLRSLIPDSVLLTHSTSLRNMIQKHPIIYLKPIEGKAGIGMMKVINKNNTHLELIYQTEKQKKKYTFKSIKHLWTQISKLKQNQSYVLQQGIQLATFKGKPFDIRILLQKTGDGEWGLTGIGIRVAGENAISTHVPMGGHIESVDTVFSHLFNDEKEKILHQIKQNGLALAKYIEKSQSGNLGEMSIDLGLDRNSEAWFFEANAKPMKFDEPSIRLQSLRRIIQYSLYLSGYKEILEVANHENQGYRS